MIVVAIFYGLNTILAFLGNLFVLLVVITQRSFHNMRYFLLASLALSDFLFAVLITSNRTIATALEEWVFGTPWCHSAAYIIRVLYLSTVFHLCAVSYERYNAIIRKPLTYNGRITMRSVLLNITLLWIVPAVISVGPFFGWGDYVYNPDIFTCEQKWDKQTAIPFIIATFLFPFGAIFVLNYKVLKVVNELKRSVYIIGFKPNKMQDYQNQPQCANADQDANISEQSQNQQEEYANAFAMVDMKPHTKDFSHGIQCEKTAAYPRKPDDMPKPIPQNEFTGPGENPGENANSSCSSQQQAYRSNGCPSANEKEERPGKNDNKVVDSGCSKPKRCLHLKEKHATRSHQEDPKDCYQANILAKMDLQIEVIEEQLSYDNSQNDNVQDVNSSDEEGGREAFTQERSPGKKIGISPQSCKFRIANPFRSQYAGKSQVESRKRNPKGKENITPEDLIEKIEHAERKANPEDESQTTEHVLQDDNLEPSENSEGITIRKRWQPGKTQMILRMLAKEGKAARDVMVIIGAFLVCYLPLWIIGIYRSTGNIPSVEAILATHCVYCSSMVWNPIIYSVRKREFRKALKTLLRL